MQDFEGTSELIQCGRVHSQERRRGLPPVCVRGGGGRDVTAPNQTVHRLPQYVGDHITTSSTKYIKMSAYLLPIGAQPQHMDTYIRDTTT